MDKGRLLSVFLRINILGKLKMKRAAFPIFSLCCVTMIQSIVVAEDDVQSMIKKNNELNSRCRGGSGDNPMTWKYCDERDALSKEIIKKGWCYGEVNQSGSEMEWHRCNERSYSMQGKAPGWYKVINPYIGCQHKDYFDQMMDIIGSGDKEATNKMLLAGVISKECQSFERGDNVYLEDVKIFSHRIKIRREGEAIGYWTLPSIIPKNGAQPKYK
jgi:hypothetical protein